jgi:hypothetical protein
MTLYKRQSRASTGGFGLIEFAIYAGIAIAVLAALAGAIATWNHYISGVEQKGYARGKAETSAAYTARDNAKLIAVIAERDKLLKEKEAAEKLHSTQLADQEAANAKKLAQGKDDFDRFVADINAGRVMWKQPGEAGGGRSGSDQGRGPTPPGGAGTGPGPDGGGGLLVDIQDQIFLASEAQRANRALLKLESCRGYISIIRGEAALPTPAH